MGTSSEVAVQDRPHWALGFSVAGLLTWPFWIRNYINGTPLEEKFAWSRYHLRSPWSHVDFLAAAVVMLVITVAVALLARRSRPTIVAGIGALSFALFANGLRTHWLGLSARELATGPWAAATLAFCAACVWAWRRGRLTQSVLTLTAAAWPLALAAVVNMVVGIYFMTGGAFPHLLTSDERLAPLLPGPRPLSGRVVILIFDTWDADAWQARSRDVETPALDALEREGFVATRVVRAGAETFMAFPGMLSGRQAYNDTPAWASRSADLVRPTRGLDLELAFEGMTERVSWLSQDNLFRAVRRAGGNVGIAGHDYHPTCVLFRDSVSACDGGGFKPAAGLKSVLGQLDDVALDIVANVPGLRSRLMSVQPPLHPMPLAADYLRTRAAVRRFAANPDLDLIFVHYFVPHHLFYDADSNDFRSWGRLEGSSFMRAYEGHFELIDRAYDDVKKALEQAGLWERTAVILSSDHGLLRYGATDARLRVPFLMKPAGRLPPLRSDAELRLAGLPRLVLSTLGGGIREPRDIESALTSAWVD